MTQALFFGSIGTLIETSEIQRQAYNRAFNKAGLDWYWSVANYCSLLRIVGGKARIQAHAMTPMPESKINEIHEYKEAFYTEMLAGGLPARPGVVDMIHAAKQANIPICWVTTTSQSNVDAVLRALQGQIQRDDFDRIYLASDIHTPKPAPDIYQLAVSESGLAAEQILAIEDTTENLNAAEQAGLNTVLFPGEYALTQGGSPQYRLIPENLLK